MQADPFRNISLQQLEALVLLAQEGNFSRAAQRMNLSQPSLTKHIQNMEDALDTPVAVREKSGVTLTPEGRIVYDYARKVLKLRDETREKMDRAREREGGDVLLAASTIPATYILPAVLSRFRSKSPQIRVFVRTADSREVQDMILNGDGEFGLVGKRPSHGKLEAEPLWRDRLILVVPADHRWAGQPSVPLPELLAEPFVLREKGSGTRDILAGYLKGHAGVELAEFNAVAELGSSEAIKEAVLAGLGVSILSDRAVRRELDRGILRECTVADWRIERTFYLIFRRSAAWLRHHRIFLNFVRKSASDDSTRP